MSKVILRKHIEFSDELIGHAGEYRVQPVEKIVGATSGIEVPADLQLVFLPANEDLNAITIPMSAMEAKSVASALQELANDILEARR